MMDRETTQRLLRESIVFLCKTHLGHEASTGLEVDAIICVSRQCGNDNVNSAGYNDPRPIVFKFHERISDDDCTADKNVDWLSSGAGQSFVNGLLRNVDHMEQSASQKTKVGEHVANSTHSYQTETMQPLECLPDLTLVKQEPSHSQANEASFANHKGSAENEVYADQLRPTKRLRSSDVPSFDAGRGRSHSTGPKEDVLSGSAELRTSEGINELEKLVSKPVMSSPPPLKIIPGASLEHRQLGTDVATSDCRSDANDELVGDNDIIDDSANGMEQSTPRSCEICGSVFADFPAFNVHCAAVHGRYACPFCALLFPCESTRERHLFEHTGETVDDDRTVPEDDPHRVSGPAHHSVHPEVGKRQPDYWSSADMSGSLEMSDTEEGGTLYDPQVVTRRGVLSCHTLRAIAQLDPSQPFVCDVCRSRFISSTDLCDHCTSAHHRIPCPYCGRSFSQKASMERHQRQHTGERPFQCTMCDSSYTRKENLQTHMSRMHGHSSSHQHSSPDFICVE